MVARAISSLVTEALGDARASELRARGADMDWDQALAYLTQTTQALNEELSETTHRVPSSYSDANR
jgi:hypothetical protein